MHYQTIFHNATIHNMEKNINHKTAVIIGAGPAGLTAALELLRQTDIIPIVIEDDDSIGGIARTVCHHGNRMDIGGHRFFSKSDDIMQWWCSILPIQGKPAVDDTIASTAQKKFSIEGPNPQTEDNVMLIRHRLSRIIYHHAFFNYPINISFSTLYKIGILNSIKVCFGFLYAHLFPRQEITLEDFYINHFGSPLYEMFFKNYTKKVWGKYPNELDADWGAQRINTLSLASILKHFFLKKCHKTKKVEKSLIEQFIYPKYGPGQLWERVAEMISSQGGIIRTSEKATAINCNDNKVIQSVTITGKSGKSEVIDCDYVFSTMPIKDLIPSFSGINIPQKVESIARSLPYRDFITIGVLLHNLKCSDNNKDHSTNKIHDTWIYVQQAGVKMGRIQIFNNWSPYLVKNHTDTVWLGLEYFCNEGDDLWQTDDSGLASLAKKELVEIGIISANEPIIDYHVERIKKAYPAYFGSYHDLSIVRDWLDDIPNLFCIGRNGQHRYNNMDHSMMTAIEAVNCVVSGNISNKDAVWNVNTDNEYHERK